jgi:hypothetical protein
MVNLNVCYRSKRLIHFPLIMTVFPSGNNSMGNFNKNIQYPGINSYANRQRFF